MSEEMTEEKIKRILTVCYYYKKEQKLPMIRLQGKWLQALGFEIGNKIEVEEKNGSLLIRVAGRDVMPFYY